MCICSLFGQCGCACKKYKSGQKNGILLVNINSNKSKEQFYYYFCDTNNFEVYCFCPILNISNENIINEDITVKENIKTDKKGVAKINTNKIKRGIHKVKITSKNSNYEISKTSQIIIK